MEKWKDKLTVPNFIIIFIILQPIIDIITGLSLEYAETSITIGVVIRAMFMVFCMLLGVIKAEKKYRIAMCTYYGVVFIYMIGFLVNHYMQYGTNMIMLQIKGLMKSFYLPIILVALLPMFQAYKIKIENKVLNTSLFIYVITIFVCSVIGIAFPTYRTGDRAGTVGLFHSANEIGAILCILAPFFIKELLEEKIHISKGILLILLVYAILQVGTKVPYWGLMILIALLVFVCLICAKLQKQPYLYKRAGMFVICFLFIYAITGLTPVGENLTKIYGDIFPVTMADIRKQPTEVVEIKNFEELKTSTVSGRNDYLKANKEKFANSNFYDKMMGISFVNKDEGQELKLTEMDYYDILFCNGIVGTILFALPILAFAIAFLRYTMLHKSRIPLEFIYSIGMAGAVALLAGHVIVSPAVSIYLVIIALKYDQELRQREERKEEI